MYYAYFKKSSTFAAGKVNMGGSGTHRHSKKDLLHLFGWSFFVPF